MAQISDGTIIITCISIKLQPSSFVETSPSQSILDYYNDGTIKNKWLAILDWMWEILAWHLQAVWWISHKNSEHFEE